MHDHVVVACPGIYPTSPSKPSTQSSRRSHATCALFRRTTRLVGCISSPLLGLRQAQPNAGQTQSGQTRPRLTPIGPHDSPQRHHSRTTAASRTCRRRQQGGGRYLHRIIRSSTRASGPRSPPRTLSIRVSVPERRSPREVDAQHPRLHARRHPPPPPP